jgi:hypothetical protein
VKINHVANEGVYSNSSVYIYIYIQGDQKVCASDDYIIKTHKNILNIFYNLP